MMKMPYQDIVQDEITEQVSKWLLETTQGLWGDNFLSEGETIETRLEREGMAVRTLSKGLTLTYSLERGNERISSINLNVISLVKQAMKKDTL